MRGKGGERDRDREFWCINQLASYPLLFTPLPHSCSHNPLKNKTKGTSQALGGQSQRSCLKCHEKRDYFSFWLSIKTMIDSGFLLFHYGKKKCVFKKLNMSPLYFFKILYNYILCPFSFLPHYFFIFMASFSHSFLLLNVSIAGILNLSLTTPFGDWLTNSKESVFRYPEN